MAAAVQNDASVRKNAPLEATERQAPPPRPLSNYRSGVTQDVALPGSLPGRDFVTGVTPSAASVVRRVAF